MPRRVASPLVSGTLLALVACNSPATEPATGPGDASVTEPGPAAGPSAVVPEHLQALGTEPFWSVAIDGAQLRYSTPEDQVGRTFTAVRRDEATGSTLTGLLAGKPFELVIAPADCNDGMSDTEYVFSASLSFGGQHNRGCARIAPQWPLEPQFQAIPQF